MFYHVLSCIVDRFLFIKWFIISIQSGVELIPTYTISFKLSSFQIKVGIIGIMVEKKWSLYIFY